MSMYHFLANFNDSVPIELFELDTWHKKFDNCGKGIDSSMNTKFQ